jgi:6-methylpretetramide 4-monooxygenase
MRLSCDIVIVGAGAGGLFLALALEGEGYHAVIVEQQPGPMRSSRRGELLQPCGIKILDRFGLLGAVRSGGAHETRQFHFLRIGGPRLSSMDYQQLPPPYNYALITRPHIVQSALLNRLSHIRQIEILWGTAFTGLRWDGTRIGGIRAARADEEIEIEARLVIGADGVESMVRKALGISYQSHNYRDSYLTMLLDRPPGFDRDARFYVGRRQILGLFPVSGEKLYLFYMIPSDGMQDYQRRGLEDLKNTLIRIDPALQDPLKGLGSWEQVALMPCYRVTAQTWVKDGVALLGDAVHAMNPHMAQGRNQAMEDAVALAPVIESCFNRADFSRVALLRYEQVRKPATRVLQRMGDELTWLWNTGNPLLAGMRDRIIKSIGQNPRLQRKIISTVSGLAVRPFNPVDRLIALGLLSPAPRKETKKV